MRKLLIPSSLLLLWGPSLFAQNTRYDNIVIGSRGTPLANQSVAVCTQPANTSTTPCSPLATIFSTAGGAAQANPLTTDINGNYHFYAAPGSLYTIQIYGPQISTPYVITDVSIPPLASNTPVLSGNNAFTGNNTMGKWNSIITVDGVQFTTCDAAVSAAVTQAGSGLALVIVPSTYAGAACTTIPTSNHVQVWYFNNIDPLVQSGIFWNTTSATPVNAWFRPQANFPSPTGNALATYSIGRFTGAIPTGSAMDGLSCEAQTYGTLTSWSGSTAIQGCEAVVTVGAAGGITIPQATGIVGYVRDIAANTSNLTNVYGIYAPVMARVGTGTWGTVVGGYFARQTAASVAANNYAVQIFGNSIVSFSGASANEKFFISGDNLQNNVLELLNTHAGGHTYDLGESCNVAGGRISFRDITQTGGPCWSLENLSTTSGAEGIMSHTNTGVRRYSYPDISGNVAVSTALNSFNGNTVALTADWTCGTGGTVSSCTSATIIGSGGGVPLTFTLPLVAQSYTLECDGVLGQATAVTANQWNLLTATNGATNVTANYSMATAATASAYGAVTDTASTTTTFQIAPAWTLGGTGTKMPFRIWGKIEGASASGTVVSLQLVAPTVGDLVTIYRGTACRVF